LAKQRKTAKSTAPELPWRASQLSRNVFEIRIPYREAKDWEQWVLLTSDQHWDNPHCDRVMLAAHLDEAVRRQAIILSNGDTFCGMQGKYDKRSSKAAVRPEHQVDHYLDALVTTAADWFSPYAHNHVFFGIGNHESALKSRHETCMIERLVALLNARTGSSIYNGGFSSWTRFSFTKEKKGRGEPILQTITCHSDHGYGGAAPVTDDIIQHQRRAVYLPDADLVISGRSHGVKLGPGDAGRLRHHRPKG
jgi:hypothetical protein